MVRPITLTKPPVPPQKVNATANAGEVARLEAQATKLREQIRLANRMGERDWAAQARQELTQVNTQLNSLQQPPTAPAVASTTPSVNAGNGTSGNGTTVTSALNTSNLASPAVIPVKLDTGAAEETPAEATAARNIVNDVTGGKSIDQIASDRGMTKDQVLASLRSGGMTVSTTESEVGISTEITDTTGRTVTEHYDYEHGNYYTEIQQTPNGTATTTPIRDGLGRKETSSYNPDTGAITTRYEDDLGSGTVTERTALPNRTTVETVTPSGGPALPVTTVTGPNGEGVVLDASQDPGGATTQGIQDDLADGKSIDQIAEERGLTSDQVIAELQAAGYEVTTRGPTSDNGDVQSTEVVDPNTGDKTVYYHDYQHDERTVVTTSDGTETTVSEDGNGRTRNSERNLETGETTTTIVDPKAGTETKIVIDKDGRITKTTIEDINGGEPVEYEVQPGDNLTLIAQQYGVTLDDLRESNPELFESPRDPDLIHPGETVTIENGTRTTVEVTFNGYTLTTNPDGKVTLTNNTTGSELKVEVGTAQQALAELLLAINPESQDTEQAKADTVLKTILEGVLGGASPELAQEVIDKQQAVSDAIKTYGGGIAATPNLDGSVTSVGPFGEPPSATAPSGGKWVPLMVDGSWQWFDPEVAKAIAAENAVIARLGEAQAQPGQSAAQLDVYALDPEYQGAMQDAKTTLNNTLAPYGLEWKAPEPKGTLADAQERLTTANNMLESASNARAEYEQGETSLLDAISKQATLPGLSDPSLPSAGESGGPSSTEINLQGKSEHAEVAGLFINAAMHTARGNKATIDQMVDATELELAGAEPGSPEYTEINGRLEELKGLQEAAASQVTLAEAYEEFGVAQKDAADLAVDVEPIKQELLAQAMERNPHHFDPNGYTNAEGDYTGKLLSQEVIEENGQLYLVNTYENDNFLDENGNDTPVLKYALTYDLNDKNIREDFRNDPLNKQWQELLASTQNSTSSPVCTPHGTGSQSALAAAKSKIIGVQVERFDAQLKDAKTKLVDATTARDNAITEHGAGTVEAPAGTLQPGEQPVKITVNGHDLWVAPEVAAAYEKEGPGAIGASGKSVQIEIDGQLLWVHPEVAAAEINRSSAETEKNQLETWEKDVRPAMVAARDWYGFYASNPKLLTYGNEEHEARLKNTYFEEHKDQALAGYQVQLKQLYDSGFTGEYEEYGPGELSGTVARTLGLDESSEGVTKVTDEIIDRAGENGEVKVVPIFLLDGGVESSTALFAIKDDGKEIGYVDSAGKYYGSFDEFQHENRIFSDSGKLILAKGGDMKLGADGFSLDELEVADGRKVDFWDKATDIGLGIVAGAATIVSFVPGGQWAIPIAIASGAALGSKALYKEGEHLLQGGDFDSQSAWNIATGVTAFLPVGAGALRTFGLARSGLTTSKAFAGGFGMARMSDASWGVGKLRVNVTQSPYAGQVASYMQSGSKLTNVAWGLDAGGVVTGVPLLAKSAEDLAMHGGEMSFAELANTIMSIGTGAVGTGLGGRGLLYNIPGRAGPHGGENTHSWAGSVPMGDGNSSTRPRAVYEAGSDGVYRPTGEYVKPSPDEIIVDGEVIGETSGEQGTNFGAREGSYGVQDGSGPTGPRALPAGVSKSPNQPPPTGGKGDPSDDGQSSRPMTIYAAGNDGVYRATNEQVFHDADHPVIPGEAIHARDTSGEGPAMLPGRDLDGSTSREETAPADGDPIVVPERPTAKEDSIRLIWNPETRSFTGMPVGDTSGYIYTSGKDSQIGPVYREGQLGYGSDEAQSRVGYTQIRDENGQLVTATHYGSPPHSVENVYVPPVDGPVARGDDPSVADKTHIFVHDPDTGEAVVLPWIRGASEDHVPGSLGDDGASALPETAPARKMIDPAPPTSFTLQQVRNLRQPEKWKAGEVYTRELNGSAGEAHFPVDANPNGPHPVFGEGGRYVDAPVFKDNDVIEAIEVKTYHRWTTIKGVAQMREVPLTPKLQEQINKDVALRNENPAYEPRWVFLDAPPSAELQSALDKARIVGNIFEHNKTPAAKSQPPPVFSEAGPGRTIHLQDKNGEVIVAAMLGTEPRSSEQVYVPPVDGPRAPADAPEVADKTHILVYDPNTGEPAVLPWIRGASDDHVPGSLGHPEEGNQPVQGAGEPTRPLRGNVGPYVFRADTRTPAEVRDAGGFSPPPPTGIWVGDPQGITLSNYVMGNTHGRFVGTSQSISGAKAFVSEESRAARQQGYTYLYTLNPSRPRLHVPTEFEAMGRPVGDRMARVDETAVDGSIPWSEVHGWRMMDPDGNFVGEFTLNPDAVAPGSTPKRPQVILRPADDFWDVSAPAETEAPAPPVTEKVSNQTPVVTGETPQVVNIAAETQPSAATWPPAPDRGRAVFDATTGRIVSLELPPSYATEPGYAESVRAPTGKEVNALSAEQISGLTSAQLHAIRPEHIAKLTPEQVGALGPDQVGQLTSDQLAALKPKQLRALSAEQLQAIRPSRLQAIAPGRITALRPDQVAVFSPEQLAALTTEQVRKLTPDQIAKLSDEQRNALTSEQFAAMRPAQFSHLDAKQFAALNPDLIAARNPLTTAKLSPDHVAALTREQLGALTIHQIEALTEQQVLALTPTQLGELSPGQLRKFTPKQFAWMTTEQTNALSVLQLTTYRATHKKTMTPDQAAAVEAALTHARIKENLQLIATFGPMAGSSYTVWQMLPPHWAATAAGVAFGVRSFVFSAQSVFPNATANHTPFGRTLNAASGASFIFSSPSSMVNLLGGKNLAVSGTFTLGNVVYGPKSVLQSITGRPVFRTVGEYIAGSGYVFGSAVYTVQNWSSPMAATAGALFTVGSVEFLVSAIRTDVLNRRPIPRMDEDINARAKADARWSIFDRAALGVTFGVGMLLFAWDTLDDQPWNVASPTPDTDPTTPGEDPSDVDVTPPDDKTDPGTQTPPEDFPQLVVQADDGLNLRAQADEDATVVTVLQPGTYVEQTAEPSTDQSGQAWIPVEGFGPDGEMHSGWVSSDYVDVHPEGSSNPEGRTNPKLEENGYQWVEVKDGDSIRLIATTHAADVADTVVLNMDHIVSPDMIFSGDRIYLPVTAIG